MFISIPLVRSFVRWKRGNFFQFLLIQFSLDWFFAFVRSFVSFLVLKIFSMIHFVGRFLMLFNKKKYALFLFMSLKMFIFFSFQVENARFLILTLKMLGFLNFDVENARFLRQPVYHQMCGRRRWDGERKGAT